MFLKIYNLCIQIKIHLHLIDFSNIKYLIKILYRRKCLEKIENISKKWFLNFLG